MSGIRIKSRVGDRRPKRTRVALREAFLGLLGERGYTSIQVSDIVEKANVARSTFYEHYKSKDDMLLESMSGIYVAMAGIVEKDFKLESLVALLHHFWENRRLARELLTVSGTLGPRNGTQHLASALEERLVAQFRVKKKRPMVPFSVAATLVVEGTMALLRDWLLGRVACRPSVLAKAISAGALASTAAILATR